jgi:molecular chaperone DnaK
VRVLRALSFALLAACSRDQAKPVPAREPVPSTAEVDRESAKVPLFADGVSNATLPLSISVETLGGVSTVLIPRGAAVPTERREIFSTAADAQTSVEVHVLLGDRERTADNVTIGRFTLIEIPPAPRGVPILEVTFGIDAGRRFVFGARNKLTGKNQPVSSAALLTTPLSQAKVREMLSLAEVGEADVAGRPKTTTPPDLDSLTVLTEELRELVHRTRNDLARAGNISSAARRLCEDKLRKADQALAKNARPEQASIKLNVIKVDSVVAALEELDEAARSCR